MNISPDDDILSCVILPDDAEAILRRTLRITTDRPIRLAYLPGPGDVFGTYTHWAQGRHDPRIPVITYSAMFYSLAARLRANALVLSETTVPPGGSQGSITFRTLPRQRSASGLRWHLAESAYARQAARLVNDWQPDVAIIHSDLPASILAHLSGLRILSMHNTLWPMGHEPPRALRPRLSLARRIHHLRNADAAVCTSPECARQLGHRLTDLPARIEVPQIPSNAPLSAPRDTGRPLRNLVYAGRIETAKGVLDLVQAFAKITPHSPGLHLHILGTGSAVPAVRTAIQSSGLQSLCTLHGHLDAAQIHAILARCDLLICPTRTDFPEGLALVVCEAALQGVPSLVSSVVPAARVLPESTLVFPADNPGALRAALARLIAEPTLYADLCKGTHAARNLMRDRSAAWGSRLYEAMTTSRSTS